MTLEEERLSALRNRRLGDLEARAAALRNPDLSASDRNDQQLMYDQLKGYLAPDVSLIDQFKNSSLGRYFNTPSKNVSNEDAYNKTNAERIAFINAADANVKPISPAAPPQAAPPQAAPPQAAPAGPQPGPVIPRALAAPGQGTAMSYFKKYEDMMNNAPDMAAMNEYAQQRGRQGSSAMLNSLLANSAGENFAPQQEAYLKQAMAARNPLAVSGGMLTNKGFVEDPYAVREEKGKAALAIAKELNDSEQIAEREAASDARANARSDRVYQEAIDRAEGKLTGTAISNEPAADANFKQIMGDLEAFSKPEIEAEANRSVGLLGSKLPRIEGVNSNFLSRLDQVTGEAFKAAFAGLKGGGPISDIEGKKGTDAITRMQRATTKKEFYDAINDLKVVVTGIHEASKLQSSGRNRRAEPKVPQLGGGSSSQTGGIGAPQGDSGIPEYNPNAVRLKPRPN